jgi:hypothetical protein
MKRIFMTTIVLTVFSAASFAGNVDEGRIEIGGNAGLATSTVKNSGSTFYLNPFVMYYIAPGFALGGSIDFSSYNNSGNSSSSTTIGPRAAYYFDVGNSALYPFVSGGFNWTLGDGNSISIPIEAGIRFFLNNFVALDAGLNLNFHKNYTDITIGAGLSMFLR